MTDLLPIQLPTPLERLAHHTFDAAEVQVFIKRDDLIHPTISGNKFRKLKYLLLEARSQQANTVLTFGGAYSNHLFATAAAGRLSGFATIGIVRGEDAQQNENSTLQFCRQQGMHLHFVDRATYRLKDSPEYLDHISGQFGKPYIIPEGGTGLLALKGVAEMAGEIKAQLGFSPTYIATAAGTGGTAAGILTAGVNALAFSSLKGGGFLQTDILELAANYPLTGSLELITDYHFGGYAKWNAELLGFMDNFKKEFGIQLEQVYTAKMFYGLFDLIKNGHFKKGDMIVAVHTGGMQGLLSS